MRSPSAPGRDDSDGGDSRLTTFAGPSFGGLFPKSDGTSARMARTGRRDTRPEIAIRRILHARGLRYRVDAPVLTGLRRRADIVFAGSRTAVFVDGCFWHGCPQHATWPEHNAAFWREKVETNIRRDRDTDERLSAAGWTVARVWEHEDPLEAADHIERLVRFGEEF